MTRNPTDAANPSVQALPEVGRSQLWLRISSAALLFLAVLAVVMFALILATVFALSPVYQNDTTLIALFVMAVTGAGVSALKLWTTPHGARTDFFVVGGSTLLLLIAIVAFKLVIESHVLTPSEMADGVPRSAEDLPVLLPRSAEMSSSTSNDDSPPSNQSTAPSPAPPTTVTASSLPHAVRMPVFPWPPPAASSRYVLPADLFKGKQTLGAVASGIESALEQQGYFERSYFLAGNGGVVLATRLEKINDDGGVLTGQSRWAYRDDPNRLNTESLASFLGGLFYAEPGFYRVIAFVIGGGPFVQEPRRVAEREARAWIIEGASGLPKATAD